MNKFGPSVLQVKKVKEKFFTIWKAHDNLSSKRFKLVRNYVSESKSTYLRK